MPKSKQYFCFYQTNMCIRIQIQPLEDVLSKIFSKYDKKNCSKTVALYSNFTEKDSIPLFSCEFYEILKNIYFHKTNMCSR